jgi:oligopeptide transport system substrate-binding protein
MKRRHLLFVVALLPLLWSCGGDQAPTSASVLDRGLGADPETLDPNKFSTVPAAHVLRDIGEGLLGYSATGELVAAAAESWDVSADGLTYTYTIRENAKWSNGDPVLAEHFAFSLRRLVNPDSGAFYAQILEPIVNAGPIAAGEMDPAELGVEAQDSRTLLIRLERPTPYLLSLLTYPATFPVHPGSIEEHGESFARAGTMLSNGAYVLKSWEPGSLLHLVRNNQYWNNSSTSIDEVRYHVLPQETTELNRYRAGELHTTNAVPPDSFAQLREERGDELRVAPSLGIYYYGFNLTRPPFRDNPDLRRALSMAVDREALVTSITGRGEAPAYGWVPPGVSNYEPRQLSYASMTQDERNAIASRIIREAGYGPDNPLKIELRYNTSDIEQRIALAVQSMWRETLGVETELINEEFRVLVANIRAREVTQLFRMNWRGDYNDAHTFLGVMESGNSSNLPGYANENYDALMQRAAEQLDPDRRRLYLEEAERMLLADHAVIPLYFYVSKHLVSPAVRGWGDNVLDYHYSQHLSLAETSATP